MSLERTKAQLVKLLGHAENSVIALSGKWGTGKTHLWNEIKSESTDETVKKSLYVSLFGVSSIDQVKRKLIESAIPGVESHGGAFDALKNFFRVGVKIGSEHYKALTAINDLNVLLMTPVVLRNGLIVIDDIERKHEKLGIDEVLGFIDEYSKQYDSRFVLLLNDDQLSAKDDQEKLWTTFREKVIDEEIHLATTAEEAFTIASGIAESQYADALRKACITCDLTNIRIVVKVIRVANQILAGHDVVDAIQARVVPSIVLFSAIHYRGLVDGPALAFALNAGNVDWLDWGRDRNKEPTAEEKLQDKWRMLMRELGIHGCDEFEKCLVEFLESGLFDAASVKTVIDRYVAEKDAMEARSVANEFLRRAFWDHRADEAHLVAEAAAFPEKAALLDPFIATDLCSTLSKMDGGAAIGEAIVDAWLAGFMATNPVTVNDENPFSNPLHAKIKDAFEAIKARQHADTTLVEACAVIQNGSWGPIQQAAMQRATAADFEAAIRDMVDLDQLRRFMRKMIEMRLQREMFDTHFGMATEQFVEACRNIANDAGSPRLAGLVKRLFENTALAPELVARVA